MLRKLRNNICLLIQKIFCMCSYFFKMLHLFETESFIFFLASSEYLLGFYLCRGSQRATLSLCFFEHMLCFLLRLVHYLIENGSRKIAHACLELNDDNRENRERQGDERENDDQHRHKRSGEDRRPQRLDGVHSKCYSGKKRIKSPRNKPAMLTRMISTVFNTTID